MNLWSFITISDTFFMYEVVGWLDHLSSVMSSLKLLKQLKPTQKNLCSTHCYWSINLLLTFWKYQWHISSVSLNIKLWFFVLTIYHAHFNKSKTAPPNKLRSNDYLHGKKLMNRTAMLCYPAHANSPMLIIGHFIFIRYLNFQAFAWKTKMTWVNR
jgi:hypothetical protein